MAADKKFNFSLYEYHNLFNQNILMSYKGPIDERIMAVIGDNIDFLLEENPQAGKKIFKIFMELAQNVWLYSVEKSKLSCEKTIGTGTMVIGEFGNFYTFVTGNIVNNEDIIPVVERCEIINSLDRESLREYKREQRKLAKKDNKAGGNIGLIQVALTAEGPLDIELTPVDEETSFFSIAVKVEKENKE